MIIIIFMLLMYIMDPGVKIVNIFEILIDFERAGLAEVPWIHWMSFGR